MHWTRLATLLFGLLAATFAQAAEFDVTVKGTDHPAKHVPIRVGVNVDMLDSSIVALSGDGYNILGQLTPSASGGSDLTFVLPELAANEQIRLYGKTIAAEEATTQFGFHDDNGKQRELRFGDRPVLRYMYEAIDRSSPERIGETYKVYHHVFDPTGSKLVTKGPGGLFPHHRGLFYGFNKISYGDQKADIWHCKNGERQNHREFTAQHTGPVFGREVLKIDWHGQDDKVFAEETRELTAYHTHGGVLLEFTSTLESKVGKLRLDGDPQHAGFQFRASQHVPDKTSDQTYYVRPDGVGQPGQFRNWDKKAKRDIDKAHINLPWNALSFVLDNQRYTCCYLDHPENPKPARFSERNYGRFGSYFEYDLDTDKPLKVQYRVWLQEDEMSVDEINHISRGFVAAPEATAKVIGADDSDDGFVSIFDGKSLKGWDGDPVFWSVKDGAITGTTTKENVIRNGNTFIIWRDGKLEDFELKLEFKIVGQPSGNSGIQYRSFELPPNKTNRWRIGGYQADFETGDRYSGICYGEQFAGRGIIALRGQSVELKRDGDKLVKDVVGSVGDPDEINRQIKKGEWNEFHIKADGYEFTHKINGATTMKLVDSDPKDRRSDGLLALQLHAGPPMEVQFRKIRVKHLNKSKAPQSKAAKRDTKKVVFVAGKRSHGYGSHEHRAGCLLLAKYLQRALPNFECEVVENGWPTNGMDAFQGADAVVFYCDGGPRHFVNPHVDEFQELIDQGVGLACLHYAVEIPPGKGGDAFVDWIGGYFETHYSVNPHWTASFDSFPDHPVARGVKPFSINDEWYFHMRFRPDMKSVTPILSAVAPKETMSRGDGAHSGNPHVRKSVARGDAQHVAWVAERPDGGRGFGFTGGHVHWNWGDPNFRKVVLNAIAWIAKAEVPSGGVETSDPSRGDLEANQDFPAPEKNARRDKTQRTSKKKSRQTLTQPVALKSDAEEARHDPQRAVANLDVHPELKAQLFAAEPLMLSPSGIDIDHRGRIWVCEVVNYRDFANRNNPVREKGDRILILEDTDGDGAADKKTVFYEGRDIDSPHGVCVLGNEVIVSANGKVFKFIDKDGDDKADEKQVMYTGISGANHDHGIHAFVFAPDGKLYFNFGNEGKQLLHPDGKPVVDLAGNVVNDQRKPYQQGMVFRQELDGSRFETIGWNFRNNWMVCVDSYGAVWQSDNDDDGNRGVRINYVMEFGNYGYRDEFTGAGWRAPRTNASELPSKHWHQNDPGVVPNMLHTGAGSPTGICIYEGDLLPTSLRGQLLHCDAGPSVTRAYVTREDGAGYAADIVNILEGTRDNWFRPTDVKIAPDGSLIVADWYDPGVGGHRMGDVERGRLFRVVPKQHSGDYTMPEFDFSTVNGAIQALKNPNNAVRYLAWTSLHEMGANAEPALRKVWETDPNPRMRARALWLLGKIEGRGLHFVDLASRDTNKRIRCQSLRLARQLEDVDVLPVVARLSDDSEPAVLRECAIALRHEDPEQAADLWAKLATKHDGTDRWYLEALGIAADGEWDRFLDAWLKKVDGNWNTPGGRDLIWRSRAKMTSQALEDILLDATLTAKDLPRFFRALDFLPQAEREEVAMQLAFGKPIGDQERRNLIFREATQRVPTDKVRNTPKYQQTIHESLDALAGTSDFVKAVDRFEIEQRYPQLRELAANQPDSQLGIDAMTVLANKRQWSLLDKAVRADANGPEDSEATENILKAVGNTNSNLAAEWLAKWVQDDKQDIAFRQRAVRSMARIHAGAKQLLGKIENDELDEALVASASVELHASRFRDIRTRAQKLMPLPPSKSAEPLPALRDLARMRGNAQNGAKVFSGVATCANCHVVHGKGKEVGPNLTEIGSKLSRQAMFEAILYPSAGISHNYENYALVTSSGQVAEGLLTSNTDEEVIITTSEGIARRYAKDDVDVLQKRTVSLMPADLQKLMTKQELIDVVEYLTTLKKP